MKTTIYPFAKIIYPENLSIGIESVIDDFVFIYAAGKGIEIGNFCHITTHCTIMSGGKITLNDFSTISPGCVILGESDDYRGNCLTGLKIFTDEFRSLIKKDVTFGKHSIIGAGSVVLPGVTIGEGCSVGAGSVVTKSLPPWTICYGTPCRPIKDKPKEIQLKMETEFLEKCKKGHKK